MYKFNKVSSKCISVLVILSLVLIPWGIKPVSAATTWYCFQDFDHITPGIQTETFNNDESSQTHGGTFAQYKEETATSKIVTPEIINTDGNGYLAVSTSDTNYLSNWASRPAAGTQMIFECKVKTPPAATAGTEFLILYGDTSTTNFMYLTISNNSITNSAVKSGSGESSKLFVNLSPDTWHYLRAYIDLTNNNQNITLTCGTSYNNPTKKIVFSSALNTTPKGMRVSPKGLDTGYETMYIDDIKAYSVDKPLLSDMLVEGVNDPFDPFATSYTVGSILSTFRIKPTAYDANTTITVDGEPVLSGEWSKSFDITFATPKNIAVVVTPLIGEQITYNLSISRVNSFIIDNGDNGFSTGTTGTWAVGSLKGYNNSTSTASSSDLATATWSPNNVNTKVKGLVDVYYWKVVHSTNVTKPVLVTVSHNGKTDEVLVDTYTTPGNTSGFAYVGTFDFAGTDVECVTVQKSEPESGANLRADSVKFAVSTFQAMAEYKSVSGQTDTDITRTGLASGNVKSEVTLANNTEGTQAVTVLMGLYNKTTGTLERVELVNDSLIKNEVKTISIGVVSVPSNIADYKIRVFVWNDLGLITPLATLSEFVSK